MANGLSFRKTYILLSDLPLYEDKTLHHGGTEALRGRAPFRYSVLSRIISGLRQFLLLLRVSVVSHSLEFTERESLPSNPTAAPGVSLVTYSGRWLDNP